MVFSHVSVALKRREFGTRARTFSYNPSYGEFCVLSWSGVAEFRTPSAIDIF